MYPVSLAIGNLAEKHKTHSGGVAAEVGSAGSRGDSGVLGRGSYWSPLP